MARVADIIVAAFLLLLLLPNMLFIQVALALNKKSVTAFLQQSSLDKLPLLVQVLQGKLTIREWWRPLTSEAWWKPRP